MIFASVFPNLTNFVQKILLGNATASPAPTTLEVLYPIIIVAASNVAILLIGIPFHYTFFYMFMCIVKIFHLQ